MATFFKEFDLAKSPLNAKNTPFNGITICIRNDNKDILEHATKKLLECINITVGGHVVFRWTKEYFEQDGKVKHVENMVKLHFTFPTLFPSKMERVPTRAVVEFSEEPPVNVACELDFDEKTEFKEHEGIHCTPINQRYFCDIEYVPGRHYEVKGVLPLVKEFSLTFEGLDSMHLKIPYYEKEITSKNNTFTKEDFTVDQKTVTIFEIITLPEIKKARLRCVLNIQNLLTVNNGFGVVRYIFDDNCIKFKDNKE